jgi:hypothetical protein
MTTIFPGMMRHAVFGDEADSNKINIVPENEVLISLLRDSSGVKMTAKFKGHSVVLPRGSAVQFIYLQAVTASGGIGYADPEPPTTSESKLSLLKPRQ